MRIALDMTPVTTGRTGVARYAQQMWLGLVDRGVDVAPYAVGRGPYPAPLGTRRVRVPLRVVQRAWQAVGRPRAEDLVGRIDLVHCLDLLPTPSRAPVVMTVHDLLAIDYPHLHSGRQLQMQRTQLHAIRRAALVLAVSQTTARALRVHGVDAERIAVVPLGLTVLPAPAPVPVEGPFLLAVGELAGRKNLPLLIEAFRAAALPADMSLVLAGPEGYGADAVRSLVGDRVRVLGRVDDATLAGLYAKATALCFPSLAEGFGLPVLEAMSVGLPVVASDLEILREVCGNAALFVPAPTVQAWAAALERVAADSSLRDWLGVRGREAAAGRTWALTVSDTVAAYERVLACA